MPSIKTFTLSCEYFFNVKCKYKMALSCMLTEPSVKFCITVGSSKDKDHWINVENGGGRIRDLNSWMKNYKKEFKDEEVFDEDDDEED